MTESVFGFSGGTVRLVVFVLVVVGYTWAWRTWGLGGLRNAVRHYGKRRGHDEANIRRLQTVWDQLAFFIFFTLYAPIIWITLKGMGVLDHPLVQEGRWIGVAGLIIAYLLQSHFMGAFVDGLRFLFLRSGKVGDFIVVKSLEYGKVLWDGWIKEIDTHGSKIQLMDGRVVTINNKMLSEGIGIENFDHNRFHQHVFRFPVRPDEQHAQIADRAILSIQSLGSDHIYKPDDNDYKWYESNVHKIIQRFDKKEIMGITAVFRVGWVDVYVPVEKHINGLMLEHELIAKFPELFSEVPITKQIEA